MPVFLMSKQVILRAWRDGLLAVFAVLCAVHASAGQMASHDYTAIKAKGFLSGAARRAVEADPKAYLSGVQGPGI
ncbi:MAG: hypothetical protein IT210_21550 [Armatimonadetes bacterium]|nr:hypothetical protein [Armatimonadota bacterium]